MIDFYISRSPNKLKSAVHFPVTLWSNRYLHVSCTLEVSSHRNWFQLNSAYHSHISCSDQMNQRVSHAPPMSWIYDVILTILSSAVHIFFRDVQVKGSWRIPAQGPLILVAAPHSNQVCHRYSHDCLPFYRVLLADHLLSLLTQ
jgi:hypothetical protein